MVAQQDANFTTSLELAIRFGKTLLVQEVDNLEPILYPVLRGELIKQGEGMNLHASVCVIGNTIEFAILCPLL